LIHTEQDIPVPYHYSRKREQMTDNTKVMYEIPLRGYPYFDVVVGLVWSEVPEGYARSNVATSRAAHVRHVKGDDPD
jgi:hypothetical protein